MPAYKNKENGSWYVVTQYTDWTGSRKPKCKRGFSTKREAQEWEQKFQQQSAGDLDMSFEAFCEIYTKDLKARLKESTWQTKENIIQKKLLPYFGKRKICEITTKDVIAWQNEMLAYRDKNHKPYSQTYLKTLHNQLSAIFNHAVRFYDLHANPALQAENQPRRPGRQYGQGQGPGNAVLDKGGVSEIFGRNDGQARFLLCLSDALLDGHPGGRIAGADACGF